jgi:hypothetical protein
VWFINPDLKVRVQEKRGMGFSPEKQELSNNEKNLKK